MDKILSNIFDPSWWFSAFFVAIFASIIAGFLKDKVSQWVGGLSEGLRKQREIKKNKRDKVINELITNEVYRQFVIFRVLLSVFSFVLLVIIYSLSPSFLNPIPEIQKSNVLITIQIFILNFVQPFIGFITIYAGFKVSSRTSLISDAFKFYREKNDLPRVS